MFVQIIFLIFVRRVLTFWLGSHGFCMVDPFFVTIENFGVFFLSGFGSLHCLFFNFPVVIFFDVLCIDGLSLMYFCILVG